MVMTVKQYKETLEEMKKIYRYDDEKTVINCLSHSVSRHPMVEIQTEDEETGITITMSKSICGDGRLQNE